MRVGRVLLAALVVAWASPVLAQAPTTVIAGQPFTVQATHDGTDTVSYRLTVNGAFTDGLQMTMTQDLARDVALSGSTVLFDAIALSVGAFSVQVAAVNADGSSPSVPLQIQVVPPPAVTLNPCAYTSPAGVSSTKPIGNDDVRGWNQLDTGDLAGVRKFYARMEQLKAWGLDPRVLASDDGVNVALDASGQPVHAITGKPWSYVYAPCKGLAQ